jgi:hypothetical protein
MLERPAGEAYQGFGGALYWTILCVKELLAYLRRPPVACDILLHFDVAAWAAHVRRIHAAAGEESVADNELSMLSAVRLGESDTFLSRMFGGTVRDAHHAAGSVTVLNPLGRARICAVLLETAATAIFSRAPLQAVAMRMSDAAHPDGVVLTLELQ